MAVEYLTRIRHKDGTCESLLSSTLCEAIPPHSLEGDKVRVYTVVESSDGLDILDLFLEWEEDLTGPDDMTTL